MSLLESIRAVAARRHGDNVRVARLGERAWDIELCERNGHYHITTPEMSSYSIFVVGDDFGLLAEGYVPVRTYLDLPPNGFAPVLGWFYVCKASEAWYPCENGFLVVPIAGIRAALHGMLEREYRGRGEASMQREFSRTVRPRGEERDFRLIYRCFPTRVLDGHYKSITTS